MGWDGMCGVAGVIGSLISKPMSLGNSVNCMYFYPYIPE